MGKKSTNLQIQERVNTVYQLLIKSYSRFEIVQLRLRKMGRRR